MKYRAAIFDLDGTLLDSLEDLADSCNKVLAAHGFPTHPAAAYRVFIGDGIVKLVQRALPDDAVDTEKLQEFVAQVRREYDQAWKRKTRPYPGIMETLHELGKRGVALAVLSNKPHGPTVQVVSYFFADVDFAVVSGAKPEAPMKPDPAGALLIASALKLPPADCVFIGDTGTDMRTAVNAGMLPVGAAWGFRPDELPPAGAERVIDHPGQLLELF